MTGHDDILALIGDILERRGAESYLGEPVTISQHMYQTAALARSEGASDALVAAALLHDIGHYTSEFGSYAPADKVDRHHDAAGAKVLEGFFPPLVTECVRLHVAAKRYLCGTDPTYYDRLSQPSQHSLSLQGGPMSDTEIDLFEQLDYHREAVRVRLWDDGGKVAGAGTLSFDDFRPVLLRVVTRPDGR